MTYSINTRMSLKDKLISIAEVIDAWRVAPRVFVVIYLYLVFKLYVWFIAIKTYKEEKCDVSLIKFLTEGEYQYNVEQAMDIACTIVDVVGGPTTAQTAFVTTIVGLSTAVFGFYTATGRKWGNKEKDNNQQPIVVNYPTQPPHIPPNYPSTTPPSGDIDTVKFEP